MNLNDERINQTLEALHSRARKQELRLVWENLSQWPNVLMGRGVRWNDRSGEKLQNKFICVDPQQGQLLYMLARCARAQTILEFGTSFGVSTIYLAAAVRDNGGGKVYGTEFEPTKAKEAKKHLEQAGLSEFVEIIEGDARQTLKNFEAPIDFALIDGFPPYNLEILRLVQNRIREGGIVLSDDIGLFKEDLASYVAYMSEPSNGFRSAKLELNGGTLLSVKTAA
ncbi:MAG: class I SAM-dependent methyltransferase [Leptospiraceae bacterium]|nr:class I SAM-dependent methyltransferase [Leptospiraceae bacterium]